MPLQIESLSGTQMFTSVDIRTGASTTVQLPVGGAEYWRDMKPDRSRLPKAVDASGWLYPKAYRREVTRRTLPHGVIRYKRGAFEDITVSGELPEVGLPNIGIPAKNEDHFRQAFVDALTKLKDQKVNLGVAMAEAQQTANLLGSTATRFARSISAFRRGRYKQAAAALGASLKKTPQNWLELQYAWKPLMADIHGSFSELARSRPAAFAFACKGIVREEWEELIVQNDGARTGRADRIRRFRGCFVRLDFLPNNTFFETLSRAGLSNPAEVLWEKVPFSFVVDWFYTVGDTLSVLDATHGFQFLSGTVTDRRELNVSVGPSPNGGVETQSRRFRGKMRDFLLDRQVLRDLPATVRPRFKNPLSLGHMANGLSLLASVVSGSELGNKRIWR